MEIGAHVWLRKEDSSWGWVPAVVTRKDPVTVRGVELINLTLKDDPNIEVTMPAHTPAPVSHRNNGIYSHSHRNSSSTATTHQYFQDEEEFEVVVTVDPEQLKTADHDDIKLRNLPAAFHLSGEDPEAGVVASPSVMNSPGIVGGVDDLIGLTHLHEPAILHALRLRYDAGIIYTATGPILIAVNPFQKMDIYGHAQMERYCRQGEQSSAGSPQTTFTTPFKSHRVVLGQLSAAQRKANGENQSNSNRLAPHVYQTGDDAYRAMMRGMENAELMSTRTPGGGAQQQQQMRQRSAGRADSGLSILQRDTPTNQSILVSGESGAGKTVTTKIVLNYFAMLSKRLTEQRRTATTPKASGATATPTDPEAVSIEQQVLQSNPILESFGNARTIRNDNSSRFGKFIDIRFTRNGRLSGASIETYLLEKVRLIHPGPGERNYHVFYQFLGSATREERKALLLPENKSGGDGTSSSFDDFLLLSQSGTYDRRDGVSDQDNHREMLEAMTTMGFSPETIQSLMRLVVGVLFAGNMTFTASRDGESCRLDETRDAVSCARLLGLSFEGLAAALTARVIIAGDEIVHKPLTMEAATKAGEALVKAVYGAAFDYIVEKVNESIIEHEADRPMASIGVLDIFGFETFDVNSFEQVCINYTNEALQQQFNKYVFKLEQKEYEKEGIMWKFIAFPDNQDVLDLIDQKHTGVLALLDEQCILPKSTDDKFTRYLYGRCDGHPRFCATSAQRVDHLFSIEHYAGYVEYTTEGWIEKNKDQLPAAAADLLQSSTFELIGQIQKYVRTEDRGGRGTVATKSVSSQFSTQLKTLRSRIDKTVPHYIRCLKPNDFLAPDCFEPKNIVDQLRCGGVLEAVRVSRAGYPTRYPHDVFLARYYILGDTRDRTPQSPVFSPKSQTEKEPDLKRLISKIAFDLWQADHHIMQALLLAEQEGKDPFGSPKYKHQLGQTKNKVKLHSGPNAPPFNMVVESSVMTPDDQRRKRKADPTAQMRERRERHNVSRPECEAEFKELDFASRCAVAGLQLGRTKVFLRREAFDRIEAMRSDKFFNSAAAIQKLVRGRMCRTYYLQLRAAIIVVQSLLRMRLSINRVTNLRFQSAAVRIQCCWRRYSASLFLSEVMLARRYAATVIQRAWRFRQMRISANESFQVDDVARAVTVLQAVARGHATRKRFHEATRDMFNRGSAKKLSPVRSLAPPTPPAPSPSPARPAVEERRITPLQPSNHMAVSGAQNVDTAKLNDLFRELQNENWAMVENILDKNPELAESPDLKTGELALHKIARHSGAWTLLIDMVLVLCPQALLHQDNMGALPIHHAGAHDNLAALEIIYNAYKEGINETDKMGRLPIHVAATYDAVDAIKFLLSKSPEGAYTMVYRPPPDSGGGLPLHIACSNHSSIGVITALLAENFASAKRTDENGDLPLHLLLRCGEVVDPVVVKTLLTCFAGALSRTDMNGDLPLSISIKYNCRSAVINAILMQYPEASGVLNGDGHSPLFLAFKHNADDRTIMGLLNHAPELATAVDRKTGLLPIQAATENEHSHFIVHNLLKRDMPIDTSEKVRAQLVPHHYSWNHIVSNTEDLYHQVVTKVLQSCTQPQVLALAHVEGPDGKIALAAATPVCKHEMRVMLRLFNTLEVVNQRPAYTNPVSDTQIFYALRYDPPEHNNGAYTILHEEKKTEENDYLEDFDDASHVSGVSRHSVRSTLTSRSQQTIDDKLRRIRKEKGQQVIAKLTSRSDVVERELKVRKDYHLSRHYVPAIISVHHTVQHAAYSEAMAEPGYCITMEGADTTAENLMLDMRKSGKTFPTKALKRIGISLLHMHEHGIIHGDFGTHNIGKFGSRWKLLGVGGSVPIGAATDPDRGFYHPPEAIEVENKRTPIGKKSFSAYPISVHAQTTYDTWAFAVVLFEAVSGAPLPPYACRGKRAMTDTEVARIGTWDANSVRKVLQKVPDEVARDLLKQLLDPSPDHRTQSMRAVLEHPFFTGGNLPKRDLGVTSPMSADDSKSMSSTPSSRSHSRNFAARSSRGQSSRSSTQSTTNLPTRTSTYGAEVKQAKSSDSNENHENGHRAAKTSSRRRSDRSNPSDDSSVKSGRSMGSFRRLRGSFRRTNA